MLVPAFYPWMEAIPLQMDRNSPPSLCCDNTWTEVIFLFVVTTLMLKQSERKRLRIRNLTQQVSAYQIHSSKIKGLKPHLINLLVY